MRLQTSALAGFLALGVAFGVGVVVGRRHGPSSANMAARAAALDRRAAAFDSLELERRGADSLQLAAAADRSTRNRDRVVALGDTAARQAAAPLASTPEGRTTQLVALRGIVLHFQPALDSLIAADTEQTAAQRLALTHRDTAIVELREEREASRDLTHQALRIARPWPTWRKLFAGASCVATGWFVSKKATTPGTMAGIGCIAAIAI